MHYSALSLAKISAACQDSSPQPRLPDGLTLLIAPNDALQTGAKHFSLMSHSFYNMIGFGRAAQIQEGNENVV